MIIRKIIITVMNNQWLIDRGCGCGCNKCSLLFNSRLDRP
ncbi:hypothetical protein JCM19275_3181 [Nonlabens ulvanivorans]|uniref:Uncharacterized protein n=1 Tax=Nonlabens ulvanivorans TaxID=906888 RepID=A0A090WBH3_NONUL|nr:hypothetical protein JCM19275_3181 [Nonlabens ulvanivorans]